MSTAQSTLRGRSTQLATGGLKTQHFVGSKLDWDYATMNSAEFDVGYCLDAPDAIPAGSCIPRVFTGMTWSLRDGT